MADETWRGFEELVAQIYRELVPAGAKVTHDDRIIGHDTEGLRQIDLSIRYSIGGHQYLTIVQVKDESSPADVNVVGEFAAVVKDVRAQKGILICRSGFTPRALKQAAHYGIDLCNAHDATSRKWAMEVSIPVLWIDLEPQIGVPMRFSLNAGETIATKLSEMVFSKDGGHTHMNVVKAFQEMWNAGRLPMAGGTTHVLQDPEPHQLLILDADGQKVWRDVRDLKIEYVVRRRAWRGTFAPTEARGLFHYADGYFEPTYCSTSDLPVQRPEDWIEVEDPDALVAALPVVFAMEAALILDSIEGETFDIQWIGPIDGGEMVNEYVPPNVP